MKFILIAILLLTPTLGLFAQKPDEVLATFGTQSFTVSSLPGDSARIWQGQASFIAKTRAQALAQIVTEILLTTEGKSRNITTDKIFEEIAAKAPAPTADDILKVYNLNKESLGDKTLEEVKPQIVEFLRREPEDKAIQEYLKSLETKYGVKYGKDINAPDLKSMESIVTVNGKSLSAQEFDEKAKFALYDVKADVYDGIKAGLDDVVFSAVVAEEAKVLNIEVGSLIGREITDKMRDFSEQERASLYLALRSRLFAKYGVKYVLKEPAPIVLNVSPDDDPSQGKPVAPVTIVMFSDFQCSACAATHPVLKKVIAEYGDSVRFVVRDFPLVKIHDNAMQAARAANAANAQGKFFEYSDILYKNQTALDAVSLKKYAAQLGLNLKQFEVDLASEKTALEIEKDMADGALYGIGGTPTIFVNGIKVRGLTADRFREAIDRALKK